MTEEIVEKQSNNGLMIGGVIILILLLAAAFMGGRLLTSEQETTGPLSGVIQANEMADLALHNDDSPEGTQMFSMPMPEAAPELPASPPEATGLFVGRADDTLTIGTGKITAMIGIEPGAAPEFNYEGIAMDVLVTNQTKLYEDVTEYTFGQTAVQQELLQLENLDDLQENAILQVWGQRDGDRIIADVIIIG